MDNKIRPLLRRKEAAIMGIINATPDSFSDGGLFNQMDLAVEHALKLLEQGADILDVGGESTRPGADKVSLQQELDRVIPLIEKLSGETSAPISIDTYKPQVMQAAVDAGASMINDINGLRADGAIKVAANTGVPVCIMHMLGAPKTMQQSPHYENVVDEVLAFLQDQIGLCLEHGIDASDIVVDPGIGFGKSLSHNLLLLKNVEKIKQALACHVLIGVSRKSMIDLILGRPVEQRVSASVGLAVQAVLNGAKIVRVHDVRETFDAIRAVEAVRDSGF